MPEQSHLPPEIGLLRGDVADMLAWVEPSTSYAGVRYYPCEATTVDGCVHPRVFVVDALSYIREVGVWPWVDRGKQWVRAESIVALRSSSVRLPAIFANVLNAAGESGMGYCAFSVDLRDGRRLYFVTGNAVDFPDWPDGVTPLDVVAVWPHDRGPEHRHRAPRHHESTAEYAWAPFRSPE